jgi:hypothetical protein
MPSLRAFSLNFSKSTIRNLLLRAKVKEKNHTSKENIPKIKKASNNLVALAFATVLHSSIVES